MPGILLIRPDQCAGDQQSDPEKHHPAGNHFKIRHKFILNQMRRTIRNEFNGVLFQQPEFLGGRMSIFDHQRLTNSTFKLDIERMRQGWYTDKYFVNVAVMLSALSEEGYTLEGSWPGIPEHLKEAKIYPGDLEVEMQWFTRRAGTTLVVGVDKALAMLRHCTGYWQNDQFIDTSEKLQVWAVHDGCKVHYDGDPEHIQPVLKGSRALPRFCHSGNADPGHPRPRQPGGYQCAGNTGSRARQTHALFPGPFRYPRSASRGWIRIQHRRAALQPGSLLQPSGRPSPPMRRGTGGAGWAGAPWRTRPSQLSWGIPRERWWLSRIPCRPASRASRWWISTTIACSDSLKVCRAMFHEYSRLLDEGKTEEADCFKFYGVRLDTGGSLRDVSVPPLGERLWTWG